MFKVRQWQLIHWLIAIGIALLILLGGVVVYVLLRPSIFVPPPPIEPVIPLGILPPEVPGPPTFPPSPVEEVPTRLIVGLEIEAPIDLTAQGGITNVTTLTGTPVQHISLGATGDTINYYDPESKRFYRIDASGTVTKISDQIFAEIESVVWAPNGDDSILEFPDGRNILYNFETGEQITLPQHWEEFDFSPDSNNIAFKSLALDPSERWLAVSSKNGNESRRIAHLGSNERIVDVEWSPNNQVVATYTKPNGLSSEEVFFVGMNNENFPLTKIHGINFEGRWVPEGNQILYSAAHQDSNFNPSLWVADGSGTTMGQNRKRINLQTWSHKCAFASADLMYCGVPISLPKGSGLIPALADGIPDQIFEVNLRTGVTSLLAIPEEDLNVENIILSSDGSQLFIQDGLSGRLKRIDI